MNRELTELSRKNQQLVDRIRLQNRQLENRRHQVSALYLRCYDMATSETWALGHSLVLAIKSPTKGLPKLAKLIWSLARRMPLEPTDWHDALPHLPELPGISIDTETAPSTPTLNPTHREPQVPKKTPVAAIVDELTANDLSEEVDLIQLTSSNWKEEILASRPSCLLVESAWAGNRGEWRNHIYDTSDTLLELVDFCRANRIPTAFWNKEDPVHYDGFLSTAALFDTIFTTDLDAVQRYKFDTKKDAVFCLPFAVQPKRFHPFTDQKRSPGAFFAGSYYAKYPKRGKQTERFLDEAIRKNGLTIFDRNDGRADPSLRFPDRYKKFIRGRIDPELIPECYRAFEEGINLNTVESSQTMFSRRALELAASMTQRSGNWAWGEFNLVGSAPRNSPDDNANTQLSATIADYLHVISHHAWDIRISYIFDTIGVEYLMPHPRPHPLAREHTAKLKKPIFDKTLSRAAIDAMSRIVTCGPELDAVATCNSAQWPKIVDEHLATDGFYAKHDAIDNPPGEDSPVLLRGRIAIFPKKNFFDALAQIAGRTTFADICSAAKSAQPNNAKNFSWFRSISETSELIDFSNSGELVKKQGETLSCHQINSPPCLSDGITLKLEDIPCKDEIIIELFCETNSACYIVTTFVDRSGAQLSQTLHPHHAVLRLPKPSKAKSLKLQLGLIGPTRITVHGIALGDTIPEISNLLLNAEPIYVACEHEIDSLIADQPELRHIFSIGDSPFPRNEHISNTRVTRLTPRELEMCWDDIQHASATLSADLSEHLRSRERD